MRRFPAWLDRHPVVAALLAGLVLSSPVFLQLVVDVLRNH